VNNEMKKKVLLIGNSRLVILKFRKELVEKLVEEGYEVYLAFPEGPFGNGDDCESQFKCNYLSFKINRRGTNILQEIRTYFQLKKIISKIKPDFVLTYTIKCNIYGSILSMKSKINYLVNITGLGKGLEGDGILPNISKALYKYSLKKAKVVFFQNASDLEFFNKNKLFSGKKILLPGSGVNLSEFSPIQFPKNDDVTRFLFLGRVMEKKGINEFLYSAEKIKNTDFFGKVEFHICGYCEESYQKRIQKLTDGGIIIYHGLIEDVKEIIKFSNCVVLPSFHSEGISNVLLEAAACARPIITTNHPGCRETVTDGVTGYLVIPKDKIDLLIKIEQFLKLSPYEQEKMGLLGRDKIVLEFDRNVIVKTYLNELEGE